MMTRRLWALVLMGGLGLGSAAGPGCGGDRDRREGAGVGRDTGTGGRSGTSPDAGGDGGRTPGSSRDAGNTPGADAAGDETCDPPCPAGQRCDHGRCAGAPGGRPGPCDEVEPTCGEGEGCVPVAPGELGCGPVGPAGTGADCGPMVRCASGNVCLSTGKCVAICEADEHCPERSFCGIQVTEPESGEVLVKACTDVAETCDLLRQDCPEGKGCYFVPDQGPSCLLVGREGNPGDECDCINCCSPGNVCLQGAGCARLCALGGEGPGCPEGFECATTGIPGVGYCREAP